jgi:hypothetical protein
MMTEVRLEVCGVPLRLVAESSPLAAVFAEYFHYYSPRVLGSSAGTHHTDLISAILRIEHDLPAPEAFVPTHAELLSAAGPVRMWRAGIGNEERFYFHASVAAYRVEPQHGRLDALISPRALESPHTLANTYTLFPLLLLLRARSRYYLHTAAVVSPHDRLYLICGGQRAGKSTLTTALGLAGWRPIADDSLMIVEEGGDALLHAFKRDFHLSVELLERWPELNGIVRRHHYFDRACVGGLEFFGTAELANVPRGRVDAVVFPQITGEERSPLEPIAAGEGMLKLADQSIFFPLWREHTERQMSLLARLTRGASFHRLLAGTEILSEPRSAARLLEP